MLTRSKIATIGVVAVLIVIGLAGGVLDTSDSGPHESDGSTIRWLSLDEGIALAKQANKQILVDVYTDWCSWCKKMDKEVYTDRDVQEVLQAHFVPVKLDAESARQLTLSNRTISESRLAQEMGVTGYPTTVFFDADFQPITKVAGYIESRQFARILRFIGEDHYKTKTYEEFLSTDGSPK